MTGTVSWEKLNLSLGDRSGTRCCAWRSMSSPDGPQPRRLGMKPDNLGRVTYTCVRMVGSPRVGQRKLVQSAEESHPSSKSSPGIIFTRANSGLPEHQRLVCRAANFCRILDVTCWAPMRPACLLGLGIIAVPRCTEASSLHFMTSGGNH